MADALCGPSNALQSFQKHTQSDRTLQQDRLAVTRRSPAQGFRSFDPRAGSLDAEFHAFETAPTNPFLLEQPAWRHDTLPVQATPSMPSWATDFQSLRISNSSTPANQFHNEFKPGAWQQEFLRQRESVSPAGKQKQPEYNSFSSDYNAYASFSPGPLQGAQPFTSYQDATAQQFSASGPQLNTADFDKAFQDAFNEMDTMDMQHKLNEPVVDSGHDDSIEEYMIQEPSQTKIGSDAIEYTELQDRTVDQDARDANALARVAGELVRNVDHETNEKFKNSQFLDLMRRIRDREVEVRNNDLESTRSQTTVETTKPTSHPDQTELRPHDPNTFQFPDMNDVYLPDHTIDFTMDENFTYAPAEPRTQISDLHPGGPHYPEQSPPQPHYAQMSGAIDSSISTDDTSARYAAA